jgi:hypothetical protein
MRLSGNQHAIVNAAAARLPSDKRVTFLLRVAGHLNNLGYGQVKDDDVEWAIRRGLSGLVHEPAATKAEQFAFLR